MGKLLPTLSKSEHAALFNLSYVRLPPNLSKDDLDYDAQVALAITQTNGIAAGVRGVGVFPNISRMNHGCSSAFNAVYSWREREQKMVVYAIRPIKQGQEILTAYFDTRRPRRERRLVQKYVLPVGELETLTSGFYHTGHIYKNITTSIAHAQCARYQMKYRRSRMIVWAGCKICKTSWQRGRRDRLRATKRSSSSMKFGGLGVWKGTGVNEVDSRPTR